MKPQRGAPSLTIDARAIWKSGLGRYTRELASRLIRRQAFATVRLAGDVAELGKWCAQEAFAGVEVVGVPGGRYSLASQVGWARLAPTLPRDSVVWFPHFDAPLFYFGPKFVVTIHDLIHLRVPGAASLHERALMRVLLRVVTGRAGHVVAVSEFTRQDLLALHGWLESRVSVVPNGVGECFLAAPDTPGVLPPGVRAPYLLVVGNRKAHKNLATAVEVLAKVRHEDPNVTLVVVGANFPEWADVRRRADELDVSDAILEFDHLDDGVLGALYRGAECLLFPSRYEGFGLPLLEAMACSTPVIGANVSSIPEITGGAALLFAPDAPAPMADAVRRVRTDRHLRDSLVARGRERAAAFSWDRAAEQVERLLLGLHG